MGNNAEKQPPLVWARVRRGHGGGVSRMPRHISLLIILCVCLLAPDPRAMAMGSYDRRLTVSEMNADPTLLSNKHIEKVKLEGLNLKNAVITNLTLKDVNAMKGTFENITFEKCIFIKVWFDDSRFTNVAFIDCKFIPMNESKDDEVITTFIGSVFNNIIFNYCDFKHVDFGVVDGENGFILLKNIKNVITHARTTFISIENAQVRVSDSIINGVIAGRKNVHAITKNSQFTKYAGIYCDNNFRLFAV